MSVRSSMATPTRSGLPDSLSAVLALRSEALSAPADVERTLSGIAFFRARSVAPAAAPRFGRLGGGGGGGPDNGRFASFRGPAPRVSVSEDGFETVVRRGPRGPTSRYPPTAPASVVSTGGGASGGSGASGGGAAASAPAPTPAPAAETGPAKFSSAAMRAVDVEDRMLARVKGKINRIGHSTYEPTKAFMQQILSGDDTDFLDELMKFFFSKASTEPAYCPLYARLIHELADEFAHFRVVIRTIFNEYIGVFREVDAGTEPDPGSADYEAFKNAQERKRERRGYSQFVAELVKLGEADVSSFETLLNAIVSVIEANHSASDKTLMCEEYIDCFATMCGTAAGILRSASWAGELVRRLSVIATKPKKDSPSLSNKARFAIMAIADSATAGWS
jgi:hypothetical protein